MLSVTLSESEWDASGALGRKREALRQSRGKGQNFHHSDRGGSMDKRNAIGAIAEYAVAKHYGVVPLWVTTQAYSEDHTSIVSDVGHGLQIRASDNPKATLWLRTEDHKYAHQPFLLVRVSVATRVATLTGWVWGSDGMDAAYWDRLGWSKHGPNRAAFNVPNESLRPLAELPKECIYGP